MNRSKTARIILLLVFVALIATPLVLKRVSQTRAVKTDPSSSLSRYGFYLQEVSQASNINFKHQAPVLDHKLDHIMPQVASMGAAVSVVDFNRDGWSDLYVTNSGEGSKNALYRNLGNGQFKDVAPEMGIADMNRDRKSVV